MVEWRGLPQKQMKIIILFLLKKNYGHVVFQNNSKNL